ncbi:hypothetical protein E2320_007163 [Naja naja]|nr:hypothetical protein E2320_007163 [Naja naja]
MNFLKNRENESESICSTPLKRNESFSSKLKRDLKRKTLSLDWRTDKLKTSRCLWRERATTCKWLCDGAALNDANIQIVRISEEIALKDWRSSLTTG